MAFPMDEGEFLAKYDASGFRQPSVAVDLVLMSVLDRALHAVFLRRTAHPAKGKWALPGGFVGFDEDLDAAAARVLKDKAQLASAYMEQLYTFGAPGRDPRTRVIAVAYFALLPPARFDKISNATGHDLTLARIGTIWKGEAGGAAEAFGPDGVRLALAFDHAEILGLAIKRLRGKIDYSFVAFNLLPTKFTLRELQEVHEAIAGVTFAKPAFRRRMLDAGTIEPTGHFERGVTYRPAELYRLRKSNR